MMFSLHDHYKAARTDGSAWLEANNGRCSHRVIRGCSWVDISEVLRVSNRINYTVDIRNFNLGFRLAQDLP